MPPAGIVILMAASFDLLRTFLAVYRAGSVTHAAELLGLSQPAVTAQVKALEAELGRSLFDRQARGMRPTAAADELAARIAGPLDALDEAVITDLGGDTGRAVHLGGPAEFTCERILTALAPLLTGGLSLRVALGMPEDLLASLADGGLDLAVSTVRVRRRGLRAEPLCDEEFVLVAADDFDEKAPLIAYAENLPILRRYWRTVFGTRLTRPPAVVVPDLRGVLAAVLAGAGVSVLPRYLCDDHLRDGRLRELVSPPEPPINTLFLVWREGYLHPAACSVRDLLLEKGKTW
jgi:DNA-binding transcriptional LysR family regulator